MLTLKITRKSISEILLDLKSGKVMGYDEIPNIWQNLSHQELRMLQLSKISYGSSYKEIHSDKYLELKFL